MEKNILQKTKNCESCVIKPCQFGCPFHNDITGFIKLMKEEKFHEAYDLLCKTTMLPALCGIICPHDKQCQGMCVKGVSYSPVQIGDLEAYVGKLAVENDWKICAQTAPKIGKKVAIVGGGPSGLTCAGFLAKAGVDVTIFEKHSYLGGLLVHGIPEFRLDKNYVQKVIDKILELGVKAELNKELGKDFTLDELEKKYDAIFLGFGANISGKMWIEGENLAGVYGGNELLEHKIPLDYNGKTVIVSGGGNVAMDVSRTTKRLGAKRVIVVYRRSESEMPAEKKEIEEAKQEGVEFMFKTNMIKILGDGKVQKIECVKTELIQKPGETRLSPVNVEGSNFTVDADFVMMAVGSVPEENVVKSLGVELDRKNYIVINENNQTSKAKVFAGGDLSTFRKTGTVAWAGRSGREAAESILKFLKK